MYKHSFSIDVNYQNASTCYKPYRRKGKTKRCTNYIVTTPCNLSQCDEFIMVT